MDPLAPGGDADLDEFVGDEPVADLLIDEDQWVIVSKHVEVEWSLPSSWPAPRNQRAKLDAAMPKLAATLAVDWSP